MSDTVDPELVDRFRRDLSRLWPELGSTDAKLGLAVSGGPDSMAMLLLAHAAIPGRFEVATVDHGLRPEARDECALVERACAERGIPCAVLSVEVGEGNVQAMAREARYSALDDWSQDNGIWWMATAHHSDDQAETLVMRLNRASGVSGLAGVRERSSIPWGVTQLIRPLLRFRRAELRSVVESTAIEFANDPSNDDLSYDRVKLRKAMANADWIDPVSFARSASILAEVEQALDHYSWFEWHRSTEVGEHCIRIVNNAPPAVFLRVLVRAVEKLGGNVRTGDLAHLRDTMQLREKRNLGGILFSYDMSKEGHRIWQLRHEPPRQTT